MIVPASSGDWAQAGLMASLLACAALAFSRMLREPAVTWHPTTGDDRPEVS